MLTQLGHGVVRLEIFFQLVKFLHPKHLGQFSVLIGVGPRTCAVLLKTT